MPRVEARDPYSYRRDPAVPAFDDSRPLALMDGECVLCTAGARLIVRYDPTGQLRIGRTQSPIGRALLHHYGLDPEDPESWLYLADGRAYTSLDAMVRVGGRLGGPGRLLWPLGLLPRAVQDWLYRRIARNRYWLFGRTDICRVPDPALRARLLE